MTLVGRGERLARVARFADRVVDERDASSLAGTADVVVEFAGTADAAALSIAAARRGGRVVLGGATGMGVEFPPIDLSMIVRGHLDVLGSVANPKGVSGRALALLASGVDRRGRASPPTTSRSSGSTRHGRRSRSAGTARSA